MKNGKEQITEALESFYESDAGELVEYLEKMLYEWYQHYAMRHYFRYAS